MIVSMASIPVLHSAEVAHMKTANKTMLELFYELQRSRGHKERLKRS